MDEKRKIGKEELKEIGEKLKDRILFPEQLEAAKKALKNIKTTHTGCNACRMLELGVKFRKAPTHTCGK